MIIVLVLLTLWCAYLAVQSSHLIHATLWLAGVSAFTAIIFYVIGTWTVAVIELSVGTGLVSVLVVFVIAMTGDEQETIKTRALPFALMIITVLLIILMTAPVLFSVTTTIPSTSASEIWQNRELDMLVQIALIFTGVLGILSLLKTSTPNERRTTEKFTDESHARLEQEAR